MPTSSIPPSAKATSSTCTSTSSSSPVADFQHLVELVFEPWDGGFARIFRLHSYDETTKVDVGGMSSPRSRFHGLVEHASQLTRIPPGELHLTDQNGKSISEEDFLGSRDVKGTLTKLKRVYAGIVGKVYRERITTIPSVKIYGRITKDLNFCSAIAELIDNAIEATKANVGKARLIEVRLDQKAQMVEICDNGCGMSADKMRKFSVLGDSGKLDENHRTAAGISDLEECNKYYMTSELSRFGLGGKSAVYYFGPTVRISSKVKESTFVHRVLLDQREIEQTKQHYADLESEAAEPDELEEGSFTHVQVTNVPKERLDEFFENRDAALRFLSEVYHFYLYGGFKRDPRRDTSKMQEAFAPVIINVVENDVCPACPTAEMTAKRQGPNELNRWELGWSAELEGASPTPPERLCSENVLLNEVRRLHEAFFPAAPEGSGDEEQGEGGEDGESGSGEEEEEEDSGEGSEGDGKDQDDSHFACQGDEELQWRAAIKVQCKHPDTGKVVRATATLAVVYFPMRKNKPTTPPGFRPGLVIVWQGRCMPHEKLELSFMEKETLPDVPPECWNRFKGFLFVSRHMEPACHKMRMADTKNYEMLVQMDKTSDTWIRLRRQFIRKLKAWHLQDDEVVHGAMREPFLEDGVEVGRCVDCVSVGTRTFRVQDAIWLRPPGSDEVHYGKITKLYVKISNARKSQPFQTDPWLEFEAIHLPGEEPLECSAPVTDILGFVEEEEWSQKMETLMRRAVRGVRFVEDDQRPMPKTLTAGEKLESVSMEAYNTEGEGGGRRRVRGSQLREKVPQLWLVLYMRKADMEVAIERHHLKSVRPESDKLARLPDKLRIFRVAQSEENEEFVAMSVHTMRARVRGPGLLYARNILLSHCGTWKFHLLPVRPGDGEAGPAPLSELESETREVQVTAGAMVQLTATWPAEAAKAIRLDEPLPDILAFPQDKFANPPDGLPGPDVVESIRVVMRDGSDFELADGYSKSGMATGGRGWVLVSNLRLQVKQGKVVKLPTEVVLEVRYGDIRSEDACPQLAMTVTPGPPCRLELVSATLKAGGGRGPALPRLSALDDFQIRAVDAHGNPADAGQGVRVTLQGEGVEIPSVLSSRTLLAGTTLDYGGQVLVTGNYGAACELRATLEARDEPPLTIPFSVAPRRLRLLLPDPLPNGVTLVVAPEAGVKRRAAAGGSSSARKKRKLGTNDVDVDVAAVTGEDWQGEEVSACTWELRVRRGVVLKNIAIEVVDPADCSVADFIPRGEAVEVSWDGDGGRFVDSRAKLPPLCPSSLDEFEGSSETERRAFVSFAGLRVDLHFLLYSEPPAALVPAGRPFCLRSREPGAASLRLVCASGAPVPSDAFARTARITAELVDSPLALETAPGGLKLSAADDGLVTVAGFSVRGCVGDAPAKALLRLRVEASEPELPEAARTCDVPFTVSHGAVARLAWRLWEAAAGPASDALRVLNGSHLPAIVVRAEDADGSLVTDAAGAISVLGPAGAGVEVRGQPNYTLQNGQALLADVRLTAARELLGEDCSYYLRIVKPQHPQDPPAGADPEAVMIRVVLLPNPERPARLGLRLLDSSCSSPAASLRAVAAEVESERGPPTWLPANAALVLSVQADNGMVHSRWEGAPEERGGRAVYSFPGFAAPVRVGKYSLELKAEERASQRRGLPLAPLAAVSVSLIVAPGLPAALRATPFGPARALVLRPNERLPDIVVRLVDDHGNSCPPPPGPAPFAVACTCRSEFARAGGTGLAIACTPRLLRPDGSTVFSDLTIGEAASGAYSLVFTLDSNSLLEPVRPASLPYGVVRSEQEAEQALAGLQRRHDEEKRVAASAVQRMNLATALAAEQSARAQIGWLRGRVGSVSDLALHVEDLTRRLAALLSVGPATATSTYRTAALSRSSHDPVRPALAAFTEQHRRTPFDGFIGFVAETARVLDDRVAEGLACFLGDRAQAAVFSSSSSSQVHELRRRRELLHLAFIPLGSFSDRAFYPDVLVDKEDPQRRLKIGPQPPAGARHVVNELVLDQPELRRTLWYYLLGDTLIVESAQARDDIIDRVWSGRVEQTVMVLPRLDPQTGAVDPATCEITSRDSIIRAGQQSEPRAVFASTRSLQKELAATQQRLADCRALLELQRALAEQETAMERV